MIAAFLFNADAKAFAGRNYAYAVYDRVFKLGILQRSGRHMKVAVGDVGVFSHARNWSHYDELTERVYFHHRWSLLHEDRLRATFHQATVFAVVFENITEAIAEELHKALSSDGYYLGVQSVEYEYGPHLVMFRNEMISKYRIQGFVCRIFVSMGEEEGKDIYEPDAMRARGFSDVDWEDEGARKTIFDDYDTIAHFQRVAAFRSSISTFLPDGEDSAYELAMDLEDLNPALFNSLGSAAQALERAANEEDVAQVSVSSRRYIEQLANALFPPRDELFEGRKVGAENYRNRIWAFISQNVGSNDLLRQQLGQRVDALIERANKGVHGTVTKNEISEVIAEIGSLTAVLLTLNPDASRKPYLAYQKRILEVFRGV